MYVFSYKILGTLTVNNELSRTLFTCHIYAATMKFVVYQRNNKQMAEGREPKINVDLDEQKIYY